MGGWTDAGLTRRLAYQSSRRIHSTLAINLNQDWLVLRNGMVPEALGSMLDDFTLRKYPGIHDRQLIGLSEQVWQKAPIWSAAVPPVWWHGMHFGIPSADPVSRYYPIPSLSGHFIGSHVTSEVEVGEVSLNSYPVLHDKHFFSLLQVRQLSGHFSHVPPSAGSPAPLK